MSVDTWSVCLSTLDWDLDRHCDPQSGVPVNCRWCTGRNVDSIGVLLTIARMLIEQGYSWNFCHFENSLWHNYIDGCWLHGKSKMDHSHGKTLLKGYGICNIWVENYKIELSNKSQSNERSVGRVSEEVRPNIGDKSVSQWVLVDVGWYAGRVLVDISTDASSAHDPDHVKQNSLIRSLCWNPR